MSEEEKTIEDTMKDAGLEVEEEEKEEPKVNNQQMESLKTQVQTLQDQIKESKQDSDEYKNLMAEKTKAEAKFSKAIGFIEADGTAKYDPETGTITRKETIEVDNTADQIKDLEKQIKSSKTSLRQQKQKEDITPEEYYELMQEDVAPLEEELRDLKFNKKLNEEVNKIKKEVQPEKTKTETKTDTREDIGRDYPDTVNRESALFKKMQSIFASDQKYANANQDNTVYRQLVKKAEEAVAQDAKQEQKNKEKQTTQKKFQTPQDDGYVPEKKSKSNLETNDISLLVGQGYKDKNIIKDIDKKMSNFSKTNAVVMDE